MRRLLLTLLLLPSQAWALGVCPDAVAAAEREGGVPHRLLEAISRVESGRDDGTGGVSAWPWTINAQGVGHFYANRDDAIAAARDFLARGIVSIDVGCLQVNLHQHPDAFSSLEEAFDPGANARYAARFLSSLFDKFRSWPEAAGAYHSQTPEIAAPYRARVLALWTGGGTEAPSSPSPVDLPKVFGPSGPVRMAPLFRVAMPPPPPPRPALTAGSTGLTLVSYRARTVRMARAFMPLRRF